MPGYRRTIHHSRIPDRYPRSASSPPEGQRRAKRGTARGLGTGLRQTVTVQLVWEGGAEPWVRCCTPQGEWKKVPPSRYVWELVLQLHGWSQQ